MLAEQYRMPGTLGGDAGGAPVDHRLAELTAALAERDATIRELSAYREMVNATPRALAFVSAADDWRITQLSAAGRRAAASLAEGRGLPGGEVVGSRLTDLFDLPELTPEVLRAQTSTIFRNVEQRGSIHEVYVAPAIDPQGQHVGALLVWTDVTARQRMLSQVTESFDGLFAAIQDISTSAQDAITTIREADVVGQEVSERFVRLRENSDAVGDVVGVIDRVASQTQLLALNATIEAARVGEAGKGFAVVASEVKGLAQETAASTGSIRGQVEGIQEGTAAASAAVSRIIEIMSEIETRQATIAAAVEEQTTAAADLRRTLETVVKG